MNEPSLISRGPKGKKNHSFTSEIWSDIQAFEAIDFLSIEILIAQWHWHIVISLFLVQVVLVLITESVKGVQQSH